MSYKPETKFEISESGNFIYNLHQKKYQNGRPYMVNDIWFNVESFSANDAKEVTQVICAALNAHYFPGEKQ